jgi:DNA replication protein DnaC
MNAAATKQALEALVEAHARELHLPTVRKRFRALAQEAAREQQTPIAYLAALLEAEVQERAERRERTRLLDARFPLLKQLPDFRFEDNPAVPQATIAALAEGSWISDRESVILIGESGTGKTHLAIALAICACNRHAASASPRWRRSRTSSRRPSRAASSPVSSPATAGSSSSCSMSSDTSPCPKAPPSSSSG